MDEHTPQNEVRPTMAAYAAYLNTLKARRVRDKKRTITVVTSTILTWLVTAVPLNLVDAPLPALFLVPAFATVAALWGSKWLAARLWP